MSMRTLILSSFVAVLAACGTGPDPTTKGLDKSAANYSVTVAATVLQQGNFDRAMTLADTAIASNQLDPRNRNFAEGIRATAALHTARYDQAAQALAVFSAHEPAPDASAADAAVAAHPNRPDGYFARAALSLSAGRYAQATGDCDIAIGLEVAAVHVAIRDRGAWESFAEGHYREVTGDLGDNSAKVAAQPYELLLLHLARAKLGRDDTQELGRVVDSVGATDWPAPVLAFYLGRIDQKQLFDAADDGPDSKARAGRRCEANFYAGEAAGLRGRPDEARDLLDTAIDRCPSSYFEAKAAFGERSRLPK